MTGPVFRRTTRHPSGVEVVDELDLSGVMSAALSSSTWRELFGHSIGRNKIATVLRLRGGVAIGRGAGTRWQLPLSACPEGYFRTRGWNVVPVGPGLTRYPADAAERSGIIGA